MRERIHEWRKEGCGAVVHGWISEGVPASFVAPPPPFRRRSFPSPQDHLVALERDRLLARGAIRPASSPSQWVSASFDVPKPDGNGIRLVFDFHHLSTFCTEIPFRNEGLRDLPHMCHRGDYLASFDLRDGYHLLSIRQEDRKYFHVDILGEIFECIALPFGWSLSPYFFGKTVRVLVKALRRRGIPTLPFVDDFLLVLGPSVHRGWQVLSLVDSLLLRLGLSRHPTKGSWFPTQSLTHLGVHVDTVRGLFTVPASKLASLRHRAALVLQYARSHRRWVSKRSLASFVGLAVSLSLPLPSVRLWTRALYDVMAQRQGWSCDVRLTHAAFRDLDRFTHLSASLPELAGTPLWPSNPDQTMATDASRLGWGATLGPHLLARGSWRPHQQLEHITTLELRAVLYGVEAFLPHLRNSTVDLWVDNTAVMHSLNTWRSRSRHMMPVLQRIHKLCVTNHITLFGRVRYVETSRNVVADALSRVLDRSDWALDPELVDRLMALWGLPDVDVFASANNAVVPTFFSAFHDPLSAGVNGLAQPWHPFRRLWLNPPWDLLPRVLSKLAAERCAATVIAPYWPSAPWWPAITTLACEWHLLPAHQHPFTPASGFPGLRSPTWRVAAFNVVPPRC